MYPLATKAPWAKNQWYIAGFTSEISDKPIARTYLNRRVVLFRDAQGTAQALSGICPHRMMPMEHGSVQGDRIVCAYHGLKFDTNGACVEAPTSPSLPKCALTKFPLREAEPFFWIWVGEPALAESTPLPPQDEAGIGAAGWTTVCVDYQLMRSRYTLLIDNLFDLSHLGFIHSELVGDGTNALALLEPRVEDRSGRLVVTRTISNIPPDHFSKMLFPAAEERITVCVESDQVAVGLINAGSPMYNGPTTTAPLLGHQNFVHAFTPETEYTTHYWIVMTRDFRQDDAQLSAGLAMRMRAVVAQDITALEAIEPLIQTAKDLPNEISMKPDFGAMQARLRVIRMINREEKGVSLEPV